MRSTPAPPLHPVVAEWFKRRFPEGPTEPQAEGWPLVASGRDTLIAAPTGSGKTLAAFLVAIDALYRSAEQEGGTSVVYVSPLKALAVDVAENLQRPLAEMASLARSMGLEPPALRVAVRTGDTSASERAAMVRRPPALLATTPESLYLLLTSDTGRRMLAGTRTVIVDEIHALARDKRGAHLALSLERLEALCVAETGRRPQRIGLSATQRPVELMAGLLSGDRPPPAVLDVGHARRLELALELPCGELEAVASAEQVADVLDRVAELVGGHRTTLVFVNTRRLAERVAHQLGERLGHEAVAAHHGSLSRERRQRVEARLRAGQLKALVATASLELGIDVGPVDLVCQIGSPRSIATFLQRVGRSNHNRSGVPEGHLFALTRDELVECAALLSAVRAGRLDSVEPAREPLDILAQQVVAEVSARECRTEELFELCRRAWHYRGLSRERFDEVVALMSSGVQTGRGRRGAHLYHDAVNGELRPRKGARLAAATSGGAIPETGDYKVLADPDDLLVGTVNEDWAVESMAGDIFLLGSHSWQVRKVEPGVVRVRDAGDSPPTVPFWLGEAPGRSDELSAEVSALRQLVGGYLEAGDPDGARRRLEELAGIGPAAATTIVHYLAAGRAALGVVPTQEDLVVERFFDDTGGAQLVLHSPYGSRLNRALGLALRKRFCRTFDFELQAAATDDAVILSLAPQHSFALEEVPRYLSSRTLAPTLEQAVLDSPMFQARWRWNLNRALLVLRYRGGRRNPPPIQRMEADDLLAAVFPQAAACQDNRTGPIEVPDHLLVRQTLDDALYEALDLPGATRLLQRLEAGVVQVHCRDTVQPSVLSHQAVTAAPYAFLDGEELQNRRVNAVRLERGLPLDPSMIASLLPEAIERVEAEAEPDPTTPDELHDLLLSELVVRPREKWQPLWLELLRRGRGAVVYDREGRELWSATETQGSARGALAGEEQPMAQALRGHLEASGVTTAGELAAASGFPSARIAAALAILEAEGSAVQGRFRVGTQASETEWVSRRLLARMHAYSRRSRRGAVEPASAQDFMRFLFTWQHVAPGSQLVGQHGLLEVVGQLQGWEAAAATWEPELLAARLAHYSPAWLDELCYAGEVAWLRLTPRQPATAGSPAASASRATPIAVVFRSELPWLLAAARGSQAPAAPEVGGLAEVVEVLRERGASFAAELAAATRRLPTDVERALWEGVARGLLICDGFSAIRTKLSAPARPAPWRGSSARRQLRPLPRPSLHAPYALRSTGSSAGRWSLVPEASCLPGGVPDAHDVAEAVAGQLLARWGVVFRQLAEADSLRLPWRELQWALRRLEDRGLVQGGRFVSGFGGEQFALPEAAAALARTRREPRCGQRVELSATDPLNLLGVVVPGAAVPAVRTNRVVYIDGTPAD